MQPTYMPFNPPTCLSTYLHAFQPTYMPMCTEMESSFKSLVVSLDQERREFKLNELHFLRQGQSTSKGASFSVHNDAHEGDWTVVCKVGDDDLGAARSSDRAAARSSNGRAAS